MQTKSNETKIKIICQNKKILKINQTLNMGKAKTKKIKIKKRKKLIE